MDLIIRIVQILGPSDVPGQKIRTVYTVQRKVGAPGILGRIVPNIELRHLLAKPTQIRTKRSANESG